VEFATFLAQFFALFEGKSFRGHDYLEYLNRSDNQRSGDEASIVDTAIVGPLLGLLGFAPAARVYNLARLNGRPDFAPEDAVLGTCFMVEDKSTALSLTLDLSGTIYNTYVNRAEKRNKGQYYVYSRVRPLWSPVEMFLFEQYNPCGRPLRFLSNSSYLNSIGIKASPSARRCARPRFCCARSTFVSQRRDSYAPCPLREKAFSQPRRCLPRVSQRRERYALAR